MVKKILAKCYIYLILLLLYAPVLLIIVYSFSNTSNFSWRNGFTFDAYVSIFTSSKTPQLWAAVKNTLIIAVISSLVSTVMGTAAAIGIFNLKRRARAVIENVNQLPIINSEVVMAVALLILFTTLNIPLGYPSLILGHISFCTPYVVLSILPKLQQMDPNIYEAALDLGASPAKAMIKGCNIHPGYAKNKMKNALLIGMEFNSLLPVEQRPEFTENYEGFIHITNMCGSVEECEIKYIIRDHSFEKFEQKKETMKRCAEFINSKYGASTVELEIKDQYYNMKKEIIPHFGIIETAIKAMEMAGIKPRIQPIRGGTDGARLSFMGLPCPNIFAGGHNFHGKMEYVPVESMEKATEVILNIISLFAREQ